MVSENLDLRGMYKIDSTYRCINRITKSSIRMQCVKFEVARRISFGYYVTCDTHSQTHPLINKRTEALLAVRKPWTFCNACEMIHRSLGWRVRDVSMTRDVSTDVKTPPSIENTNPDYYKGEVHELHFTEALRNLAKRNPADVSAIGVSVLIDHIEELEKEIERLNTMLKSKEVVIASQEGRINKLALDLLQIKGLSK